jgi:hypothetical protein
LTRVFSQNTTTTQCQLTVVGGVWTLGATVNPGAGAQTTCEARCI